MSGIFASELAAGVRKLQTLNKDLSDVAFKEKILDLRQLLISAQEELLKLRQQLNDKEAEIERLRAAFSQSKALIEHRGFKFEQVEGAPVETPFCPLCEQKHNLYIHLTPIPASTAKERGNYRCPNCPAKFGYPVPTFDWPEAS